MWLGHLACVQLVNLQHIYGNKGLNRGRQMVGSGSLLVGGNFAHTGSSSTYVTLGRVPEWDAPSPELELTWSQPALPTVFAGPRYGAVERHGRRSGGLAASFIPVTGSSEVIVSIGISSPVSGSVHVPGLVPEFAEAVLRGFKALSRSPLLARLGAGRLEIAPTWWHAIDSSTSGFCDLAATLVGVLYAPAEASAEEVWAIWRDQRETLELAPLLAWLAVARERIPLMAAFHPGALPLEIAALEAKLGLTLPDVFRETLGCVDGGRFAGPWTAANQSAISRYTLLRVEDIASTYLALAASQMEASLSKPDRPLFRLLNGAFVSWPFVPIAQDIDTGSLLVLEVLPAPYSNRVQLADAHVRWADWPVLYPRYVDFIGDLLGVTAGAFSRRNFAE